RAVQGGVSRRFGAPWGENPRVCIRVAVDRWPKHGFAGRRPVVRPPPTVRVAAPGGVGPVTRIDGVAGGFVTWTSMAPAAEVTVLQFIRGKYRGQEFPLDGRNVVAGRSSDADLVLADDAVSR